ncbi:MAG: DUF5665 domain-containing protein [Patescibacteria group bacterium]|nr:DUF5665 domain-containing protein [Patescibacteria group bacterium]
MLNATYPKSRSKARQKLLDTAEKIGLVEILETMERPRRVIWINFLIGTMRGLGFLLGTMIVVAILVWMFKILGGVPLIGEWVRNGADFIRENADLSSFTKQTEISIPTSAIPDNMTLDLADISK